MYVDVSIKYSTLSAYGLLLFVRDPFIKGKMKRKKEKHVTSQPSVVQEGGGMMHPPPPIKLFSPILPRRSFIQRLPFLMAVRISLSYILT